MPTGKLCSFKVFYDGKPLPKAKAEVVTEFGWTKELKTDEAGAFEVELPLKAPTPSKSRWSTTRTPCTTAPRPMTEMRLVTILTFKVPDGLAGPARPPVVTPKR